MVFYFRVFRTQKIAFAGEYLSRSESEGSLGWESRKGNVLTAHDET